jgi:hypothetical protein
MQTLFIIYRVFLQLFFDIISLLLLLLSLGQPCLPVAVSMDEGDSIDIHTCRTLIHRIFIRYTLCREISLLLLLSLGQPCSPVAVCMDEGDSTEACCKKMWAGQPNILVAVRLRPLLKHDRIQRGIVKVLDRKVRQSGEGEGREGGREEKARGRAEGRGANIWCQP